MVVNQITPDYAYTLVSVHMARQYGINWKRDYDLICSKYKHTMKQIDEIIWSSNPDCKRLILLWEYIFKSFRGIK